MNSLDASEQSIACRPAALNLTMKRRDGLFVTRLAAKPRNRSSRICELSQQAGGVLLSIPNEREMSVASKCGDSAHEAPTPMEVAPKDVPKNLIQILGIFGRSP